MRARSAAGFTLIEIMAVVLIFVLIAAVIGPRIVQASNQALTDEARKLAATLDFTRGKALALGRPHRVVLDLELSQYWIEALPPPLPPQPLLAWSELDELPLIAPRAERTEFTPLIGPQGRPVSLGSNVRFTGVETEEGEIVEGFAPVTFGADGGSPASTLWLEGGSGIRVRVEVAALADPTLVVIDAPQ